MNKALVKYMFLFISLSLFIGSLFIYRSNSIFVRNALEAEGTVIDLIKKTTTDTSHKRYREKVHYYPKIRFKDLTGHTFQFESNTGSNPASYSMGEKVTILYLQQDPHKAKIKGFFSLWGVPLILGFIGGIFFMIGLFSKP